MKKTVLVLLVMFAAVTLASAGSVSKSVSADPSGEVSIELISGNVEIIGWDRDEVEVTGTVGPDVEEVEVESDGGDVSIEVKIVNDDEKRSKDIDADLTVRVPRESTLEVETVSANVSVDETSGTIELESVSGTIKVAGSVREADVASVSGQISVVSDDALEDGDFETVSGNIEVRASFDSGGDFSFESVSGNITLYLPSGTAADFDVETFSGKIDNDFGAEAKRESEYVPGKTLQFSTGSGGAQIEIESFSGRIEIRED